MSAECLLSTWNYVYGLHILHILHISIRVTNLACWWVICFTHLRGMGIDLDQPRRTVGHRRTLSDIAGMPWLLGGSADLANSCLTTLKDAEAGQVTQEIPGSLVPVPVRPLWGNTPNTQHPPFWSFWCHRKFGVVSEGFQRYRSHFSLSSCWVSPVSSIHKPKTIRFPQT